MIKEVKFYHIKPRGDFILGPFISSPTSDNVNFIFWQWLNVLNSMLREAEWARDNSVPALDEYMENGYVSFALGPVVLPALYLVGPKLSEDDVQNAELNNLYKLVSTCGRLLNDIQSFKVDKNG